MNTPENPILPLDDWKPGQPAVPQPESEPPTTSEIKAQQQATELLPYLSARELKQLETGEITQVKDCPIAWIYAPAFLSFDNVETLAFEDQEGIWRIRVKFPTQVEILCYGAPAGSVFVNTDMVGRGKSWHGACVGFHRLLEAKVADEDWTQFAAAAPEDKKPEMAELQRKVFENRKHWGDTYGFIDH